MHWPRQFRRCFRCQTQKCSRGRRSLLYSQKDYFESTDRERVRRCSFGGKYYSIKLNKFISGRASKEIGPPKYCVLQALIYWEGNSDHHHGILWAWWLGISCKEEEVEERAVFWNWDHELVCATLPIASLRTQSQDIAPRYKILKYLLDQE